MLISNPDIKVVGTVSTSNRAPTLKQERRVEGTGRYLPVPDLEVDRRKSP